MSDAELTRRAVDDLTAFLRKRIADDRRNLGAAQAMGGPQHIIGTMQGTTVLMGAGRFAAELDAKERELDRLEHAVRESNAMAEADTTAKLLFQTRADYALNTARSMALPYATHPDYKEDWRP